LAAWAGGHGNGGASALGLESSMREAVEEVAGTLLMVALLLAALFLATV